jgi:hypothetical protein
MVPLLALVAGLRDLGVDVDPDNLFARMFFALHARSEATSCGTLPA